MKTGCRSSQKYIGNWVIKIKKVVNAITISRIVGAFSLLLFLPVTLHTIPVLFYVVYGWCVLSDFIDGPIARKTKSTSELGSLLDSVADILLVIVVLFIFLPILDLYLWMAVMVVIVLSVRALSFSIGFKKYRTFTMLHTYSTKTAGALLGFFPILLALFSLPITITVLFIGQFLASLEELAITIRSKHLDRNVTSVFTMNRGDAL
jgi:CDP-diacylglycerol--glycerol-3-phosphate 3-phosphatidyltransferase